MEEERGDCTSSFGHCEELSGCASSLCVCLLSTALCLLLFASCDCFSVTAKLFLDGLEVFWKGENRNPTFFLAIDKAEAGEELRL